ncbi:hypothetical protein KAJ27_02815 [bacterium]|nr:hypothetical protein [bacterium]
MDNIRKKIKEYAIEKDGKVKLKCGDAFKIAEELGIKPGKVGKICQEDEIKISSCTLGCFK